LTPRESAAGRATLGLLAAVASLVVLLRITAPVQEALATTLGREVDCYLQERVMAAVGRPSGIAHLEDAGVLDRLRIVRGLGMDTNRPSLAIQGLARVLPAWLKALGSAAILLWFHWWLGLAWLVTWPIVVFYMQREYLRVGQVGYGQSSALRRSEYLRDLAITAAAAKELRVWGMLDWLVARFEAAWRSAIEPVWRVRRPRGRVLFGTSGAVTAINLASYGLLAWAAIRGDLSLAALAVYTQALAGANGYTAFDDANAHLSFAAISVPKILELDGELEQEQQPWTAALPAGAPRAEIRFENVGFRYPGADRDALKGLDLVIPAHRSLAIVGDNGAGKTSLIKLLCRLYDPSAGRIAVDGIDLRELEPAAWRSSVAVLFQDFARYQLSMRDNVGLGAPDLAGDLDRLRTAADKAGILKLIESLPHGWDTVLSREYAGGVDLSGGQWQRVALARAMFAVEAGARLLVLDEPTAVLDVRAEAELYERFLELTAGLTTILISHRFSTVRRADRIVVLAEGRIVEGGRHDELLARGGRYARMFRLQAARFSEAGAAARGDSMREAWRAYRVAMAIGFRATPLQAAFQLLTGILMALSGPVAAYGAKLLIDAAVAEDLRLGMAAAGILALTAGLTLVTVFYYVDCVFGVFERSGALVSRRLMTLMGGADGLVHFERPDYLDQVQRVREEHHGLAAMVNATAGILRAGVTLIATAVLLARIHPLLLLLPAFGLLSFWLGKRSQDLELAAQEVTSEPERLRRHLFEVGTDAPSGKELRVFGLTGVLLNRHHQVSDTVLRARNRATWRGALLQSIDGLVSGLAYVGAIGLVLVLAIGGRATPGDVILAVGLAAQMSGLVFTAVAYGTSFLRVLKLARRFLWLEDYAGEARRTVEEPVPVPERLTYGIELREVSFGYPDTGRLVLDRLSLQLPAGKVVALVGENGASKTALIKLLCNFYQPDGGEILVDGVNMIRFSPDAWRGRISAAFQDFARLEFLAYETVGVADLPRIDDRGAVGAARERAGASGVLAALPRGLDTQLGTRWEGGIDLSGGQWQKLALGRGLMRAHPLLVVFDEPTAALDAGTEHALFERFTEAARVGRDRGTVTLLVSHRFSTVRMADLIVVLASGRVVECGSHQELMSLGGLYAELYELQSQAYR
jgi:ATP-binding cassette, subfamily B, bacterial